MHRRLPPGAPYWVTRSICEISVRNPPGRLHAHGRPSSSPALRSSVSSVLGEFLADLLHSPESPTLTARSNVHEAAGRSSASRTCPPRSSGSERLGIMTAQIDSCPDPGGLGGTIPAWPCHKPGSARRPEHCEDRRTPAGKLPVQTRLLPCSYTVVRLGPPKRASRRAGGNLLWGQGARSAPDRTALVNEES